MTAPQLWCPKCEEHTALIDSGHCPWCDTPLERRRRRGGWKRPDLTSKVTDVQLRALYRAHIEQGRSINALAKMVHERVGYKNHHGAAVAISAGWKRLGLPARGRIEATVLASTTHGRKRRYQSNEDEQAYRRWRKEQMGWNALQGPGRPNCKGVKVNPPGKGKPCTRHALEDSDYCFAHDPRRELERQAITARMRARQPRDPMLPAAPFVAWLNELHAELGAWKRVGERIGMHTTQAHKWSKQMDTGRGQRLERVSVRVVKRSAEHAGTTVEAIYDEALELAA